MILVYFVGYGEWLVRDGDSLKLAIVRKSKEPYKDLRQHKIIETYCSDYEEWLGLDEDNSKNFSEWARLYESTTNSPATQFELQQDYESKELKYDFQLRGIFIRDPDVKGDVFDTNGLRCLGPNYVDCKKIESIFKLTDRDENRFRRANFPPIKNTEAFNTQWNEFAKSIEILLPCDHPESHFMKLVDEGKLSINDLNRVFFGIQDKQFHDFFGRTEPTFRNNDLYFDSINCETSKESLISKQPLILEKITTYRNTISVLISVITGDFPCVDPHPCFSNKIDLIDTLKKACDSFNIEIEECFYHFSVIYKPSDNEELRGIDLYEEKYLKFIGILWNFIFGKLQNTSKHPNFRNQGILLDAIDKQYDGYFGLSKSTLSHLFPKAKRSLKRSI
jgi:hypothetical protein